MVIGLRAFSDGFAYVVLDGTQKKPKVIQKDRLFLPKGQSWPESLSWIRKQIAEVVEPHIIESACIKTIEPMARKKSMERYQIEAILQEYLRSTKSIDCTKRIKSQLKRDIKDFKDPARYIERALTKTDMLTDLNTIDYCEATLAAIADLPEN